MKQNNNGTTAAQVNNNNRENMNAAEYMAQGYAVACYDQTPEGKSRPAKFYGNIQRHANDYVRKQAARLATA